MSKLFTVLLIVLVGMCFAKQHTEIVKVLKPDTIITVRTDTTILYDTLYISKVLNDTILTVKQDTATKKAGKPAIKMVAKAK
jgi:hypothetical protein